MSGVSCLLSMTKLALIHVTYEGQIYIIGTCQISRIYQAMPNMLHKRAYSVSLKELDSNYKTKYQLLFLSEVNHCMPHCYHISHWVKFGHMLSNQVSLKN